MSPDGLEAPAQGLMDGAMKPNNAACTGGARSVVLANLGDNLVDILIFLRFAVRLSAPQHNCLPAAGPRENNRAALLSRIRGDCHE